MEMDVGEWVGQPYVFNNHSNWLQNAPHGGETASEFLSRLRQFIDGEIKTKTNNKNTIVVCHGLVIQGILALLTDRPLESWHEIPIHNGSITKVSMENTKFEIIDFNSVAHFHS